MLSDGIDVKVKSNISYVVSWNCDKGCRDLSHVVRWN